MAKAAAILVLPRREPAHIDLETVPLLAESLDDLRLAERVERALHASAYAALRGVRITVHARAVILAGRVPSYYLKQVAQTLALAVPGILQIQNGLEVVPSG
jgi:osmotically-inducible protein OsmY